jgi:uncharacterized membrane protein YcaP (DUF421 family)
VGAILRALFMYLFLLVLFSIGGKRMMGEMDTFDIVTLLVISEATQNALIGENLSITYGSLVVLTLVACSVFMAWVKVRKPRLEVVLQGGPLILVEHGRLLRERMRQSLVDEQDILYSARKEHGLERLDQIKYAILETTGYISIIPAT